MKLSRVIGGDYSDFKEYSPFEFRWIQMILLPDVLFPPVLGSKDMIKLSTSFGIALTNPPSNPQEMSKAIGDVIINHVPKKQLLRYIASMMEKSYSELMTYSEAHAFFDSLCILDQALVRRIYFAIANNPGLVSLIKKDNISKEFSKEEIAFLILERLYH